MSEIISIIYGKFIANVGSNGPADSTRNKVTVNTALAENSFDTTSVPLWYFNFCLPLTEARWITYGNNIRILSAGIVMPHGIIAGTENIVLTLQKYRAFSDGSFGTTLVNEFRVSPVAPSSAIEFPGLNYEVALDVFIPFPERGVSAVYEISYMFEAVITSGNISSAGLNALLDGNVYTPIPFFKILHNTPLDIVP